MIRLRAGFVVIAMVLSFFGARLVQLQAIDPESYAEMAAAEGSVEVVLPAERGEILDRNGVPLAGSIEGVMVVADPLWTAPGRQAARRSCSRPASASTTSPPSQALRAEQPLRVRRPPGPLDAGHRRARRGRGGRATRDSSPVATRPATTRPRDVAANLVGFLGTPDPEEGARPLAGFELAFDKLLSGTDGSAHYQVSGGNRIPLGVNTIEKAVDGQDLHTTIDLDLQWYVQRVLRQTVEDARGESGIAIVMDSRTGELLALADHPTYDATKPLEARRARTSARGR